MTVSRRRSQRVIALIVPPHQQRLDGHDTNDDNHSGTENEEQDDVAEKGLVASYLPTTPRMTSTSLALATASPYALPFTSTNTTAASSFPMGSPHYFNQDHSRRRNPHKEMIDIGHSKLRRRRKQYRYGRSKSDTAGEDDEPFACLVFKVGSVLGLVCVIFLVTYHNFVLPYRPMFRSVLTKQQQELQHDSSQSLTYDDDDDVDHSNGNAILSDDMMRIAVAIREQEEKQRHRKQEMSDSLPYVPDNDDVPVSAHADHHSAARAAAAGAALSEYPPLPIYNLSSWSTNYDAYGIANQYGHMEAGEQQQQQPVDVGIVANTTTSLFWQEAERLRSQFVNRYGGENAARALLERALWTPTRYSSDERSRLPSDLKRSACRIREAQQRRKLVNGLPSFRITFGGYSVTAGRGNFFSQSYPMVMQELLQPAFAMLGLDLQVQNAAIGGVSSFPYGWCMPAFYGVQADVVGWDYSMNEPGGDPAGLEAYLRHALQLPHQPQLLLKDTHLATQRRVLLQQYALAGLMPDPVVLHADPAVKPFLERPEAYRPPGFQQWRQFGAPPGAPGQALHHPAVAEHTMLAWIWTMHFLSSLELVAADMDLARKSQKGDRSQSQEMDSDQASPLLQCALADNNTDPMRIHPLHDLPAPMLPDIRNGTDPWLSSLYGEPLHLSAEVESNAHDEDDAVWRMNPVHCRTSYEPIVSSNGEDEDSTSKRASSYDLSSIVLSGAQGEFLDILLPKSLMFYNKGWVLDMSEREKNAKRNSFRYGEHGLGFVDAKRAYYGIYSSGALRLMLPHQTTTPRSLSSDFASDTETVPSEQPPKPGDRAVDWFKAVMVCQVNEKRDIEHGACDIRRDVQFALGGGNGSSSVSAGTAVRRKDSQVHNTEEEKMDLSSLLQVTAMDDAPGTLYLGQSLCVHILVPPTVTLSSRAQWQEQQDQQEPALILPDHLKHHPDEHIAGLMLEISVHNKHIMQRENACSISHVIWEQQQK